MSEPAIVSCDRCGGDYNGRVSLCPLHAEAEAMRGLLAGFLDVPAPAMERPYPPSDYDLWRILRKDARRILASIDGGGVLAHEENESAPVENRQVKRPTREGV